MSNLNFSVARHSVMKNHVNNFVFDDKEYKYKIYAGSACTMPYCSCSSFVSAGKYDAQWCENCGHARSKHTGR